MAAKRAGRDARLDRCPECGAWRYNGNCRACAVEAPSQPERKAS